nr:hypothetical protein [Rubrobacter marinus]
MGGDEPPDPRRGLSAKLAGPEAAVPAGAFDAAYTVKRNAYTGGTELEILDWRGS